MLRFPGKGENLQKSAKNCGNLRLGSVCPLRFGERASTFGERASTFGDNRGFRGFWNFFFCCWGVLGLRGSGGPVGVSKISNLKSLEKEGKTGEKARKIGKKEKSKEIEKSKDQECRPGKPNQRKGQNEKFMNFALFLCEFWCFFLRKTSTKLTSRTFVPECPCEKFMN